jgi:hypothetical protein
MEDFFGSGSPLIIATSQSLGRNLTLLAKGATFLVTF